jgi:nucleoside recognition membrane protein YjiH
MQNPFETGHIKNYLLFYVGIVVIMILFFIASTLFHEVEQKEKKIFSTEKSEEALHESLEEEKVEPKQKFELLEKRY